MKVGFIGLGIMGKAMAANLCRAGIDLRVYDLVKEAIAELEKLGAAGAESVYDVAENRDIIITMLPNSPQVLEVLSGEAGLLKRLAPATVVVDMSSINPVVSKELAKEAESYGIEFIDAPVSGGQPKAIDGTLSIMCGGRKEVFDRVLPLFDIMGSSAVLTGEVGSGNTAKLVNQMIVAGNIAVMSEAFCFAAKTGCSPELIFEAIRGGLAGSTVMEAKMPVILRQDFKPGFRLELHKKDMCNVLESSEKYGAEIPLTEEIIEIMDEMIADGYARDDHSVLVHYFEERNGVIVRPFNMQEE